MYDIIARRRLSTVLRYIFDFLPKEETSIHLNTKKAVLSDRRNSDTEPYIMLNIFFVEDIFSPRCAAADKSRRRTLSGFCLPGFRQTSFPLPLFSRLSVSAFLLHHRIRFKTLQYCPSSVAAADKSRRRTLSGVCLPGPRQTSFPLPLFSLTFRFPLFTAPPYAFQNSSIPTRLRCSGRQIKTPYTVRPLSSCSPANFVSPSALFSPFGFRFLPRHRMRFKTLQYCPSSVAAADKSRRRTLSGICLPVPGT